MNRTEMEARLQKLNDLATKETDRTKIKAYLEEAKDLAVKIDDAKALEELDNIAKSHTANGGASLEGGNHEDGTGAEDAMTERGKSLLAGDTVNIEMFKNVGLTTEQTVLPNHTATTVNEAFNEVSSLVDLVDIVELPGGETYEEGYVISYGEGDYTAEGDDSADADTKYGYAKMNKCEITAYTEVSNAVAKLAPAVYGQKASSSVETAMKKKMSRQIMIGDGKGEHLCGIFHNSEKPTDDAIDKEKDIALEAIDRNTLRKITLSYGGEEDCALGGACLIMSKADLIAFSEVEKADGDPFYDIQPNGNTGFINKIPYILNAACKPLSAPGTLNDDYCMAYGNPKNYKLAQFSPIELAQSEHAAFKKRQIAHRGSGFFGGNVVKYNGFVRVKKKGA